MSLKDKLTLGQDVKVDVEGETRELNVIYPSFGPLVILADKQAYFDSNNKHPDIPVFYLNRSNHKLNPEGEIVSFYNAPSDIACTTISKGNNRYDEFKSVLECSD